jgi:hypothetical protein
MHTRMRERRRHGCADVIARTLADRGRVSGGYRAGTRPARSCGGGIDVAQVVGLNGCRTPRRAGSVPSMQVTNLLGHAGASTPDHLGYAPASRHTRWGSGSAPPGAPVTGPAAHMRDPTRGRSDEPFTVVAAGHQREPFIKEPVNPGAVTVEPAA